MVSFTRSHTMIYNYSVPPVWHYLALFWLLKQLPPEPICEETIHKAAVLCVVKIDA